MKNITFSQQIINWHKINKIQDLPWQLNKTMYHTWLSEIMLQQTQVNTVIPYYIKFIQKFPTITQLATTELNKVLYLWSGLGYYARAKNLHKTANIIVKYHNNKFPEDFSVLMSFPGIGRSTAGAILSLTLNKRYPILDSNVKRILIRYYAIDCCSIKDTKTENKKKLWYLIEQLIPKQEISIFNQAIMNLGRLVCININPKCHICPIHNKCQAFLTHNTKKYPKKTTRKKLNKKTMWLLLLLQYNNTIWLEKRLQSGIWKELFCFPEFPTFNTLNDWLILYKLKNNPLEIMTVSQYKLSNLNLEIKPVLLNINVALNYYKKDGIWCDLFNLPTIGIPTPIFTILKKLHAKCKHTHCNQIQ